MILRKHKPIFGEHSESLFSSLVFKCTCAICIENFSIGIAFSNNMFRIKHFCRSSFILLYSRDKAIKNRNGFNQAALPNNRIYGMTIESLLFQLGHITYLPCGSFLLQVKSYYNILSKRHIHKFDFLLHNFFNLPRKFVSQKG